MDRYRERIMCAVLILSLSAVGCSTVTVTSRGSAKRSDEPTYESMKSYFLWGLIGSSTINVDQVCGKSNVVQVQAQDTFLDGFLDIITLGIYAPRTAKVWCDRESSS